MRRTKEEAEQTRRRIMAAALRTFNRRGISRTTMEDIARAARVTRGAIYWHFRNKQELLRAIREDVSLPLIDRSDFTLLHDHSAAPFERIERFMLDLLRTVEEDGRVRTVFRVMSFKCEYVGELEGELKEHARRIERLRKPLTQAYSEAAARGEMRIGIVPEIAALETLVFICGLLRLCLLDDEGCSEVRHRAQELVAAHVGTRRVQPGEAGAAGRVTAGADGALRVQPTVAARSRERTPSS
jgi:TetR/AcrR family transcriptional regulator, acrAB operon repressor